MLYCKISHTVQIYRVLLILLIVFACIHSYAQSTQSQSDSSAVSLQTTDILPEGTEQNDNSASERVAQETQQATANDPGNSLQNEQDVFDIEMLIERMKQTDAIGVISKLSLKNKVDDLLEQAREINEDESGSDKTEQTQTLRENFEGLILKTVALLNKGEDFSLAEDIYLARDELWKSIMENKA